MARPHKVKRIHPDQPIEAAAPRIFRTRLEEFYSHWPDPAHTPDAAQLHNLRISGKRLRYSAECLRELYPGRLALLIDLLKRSQDLLGVMQDCETQRRAVEREIALLRRREPNHPETPVLETLIAEYRQRQALLLEEFREIWFGMTTREFRKFLRALTDRPRQIRPEPPALHLVRP